MTNAFTVLVPLGAALLGSAIGGGLTLAGVLLTIRNQGRQDRLIDQRALRDARIDRIRSAYASLIKASTLFQHGAFFFARALESDNPKEAFDQVKNEWFITDVDKLRDLGREAQVVLFLEAARSSVQKIVNLYGTVQSEYWKLKAEFDLALAATPDSKGEQPASDQEDRSLPAFNSQFKLIDACRKHLSELERVLLVPQTRQPVVDRHYSFR